MRPQQRGGWAIAVCGLLLLLLSGVASADTAVAGGPAAIPNAADGEPFQTPAPPSHAWAPGDVFSLHGVDQYRYIVAYTRAAGDDSIQGCYEVEQEASGRYVVTQYVHSQEVFTDAFIAAQGGRFIANVPLDQVVITDDTPLDGGKTYFGRTLGSIYGTATTPSPTSSPEPIPTAPHWPTIAPAGNRPTAAPTGVVSVTRTPGPEPTLPDNAVPFPMPTVSVPPAVTEPVVVVPTNAPELVPGSAAPVLEPAVTPAPTRSWGRRYATWQAPSVTGRRGISAIAPEATVSTGSKATRATRPFGRIYPRWALPTRSAI